MPLPAVNRRPACSCAHDQSDPWFISLLQCRRAPTEPAKPRKRSRSLSPFLEWGLDMRLSCQQCCWLACKICNIAQLQLATCQGFARQCFITMSAVLLVSLQNLQQPSCSQLHVHAKDLQDSASLPWLSRLSPNCWDSCTKNVTNGGVGIPYSQEQSSVLLPKPVAHHCHHSRPTCRLIAQNPNTLHCRVFIIVLNYLKHSHKYLHHYEVGNVMYLSIISHTQQTNKDSTT